MSVSEGCLDKIECKVKNLDSVSSRERDVKNVFSPFPLYLLFFSFSGLMSVLNF